MLCLLSNFFIFPTKYDLIISFQIYYFLISYNCNLVEDNLIQNIIIKAVVCIKRCKDPSSHGNVQVPSVQIVSVQTLRLVYSKKRKLKWSIFTWMVFQLPPSPVVDSAYKKKTRYEIRKMNMNQIAKYRYTVL